ncbi:hypothetical protein WA026_015427 [Henosepilachna vigintioctopunctata]|uniref:BED-type domain-containing protein n=1 Tax=Henosepilachna vigintioctopunctata TaxID=420089 RepID=A0AAW1UKG5_9CUCU
MSQRERNPIWQYFDESITDTSKAVCKICNKSYSLGSHKPKKQTLLGLKLHLSKFHDKEYRQVLKQLSELNDFKNEAKLKRLKRIIATIELRSVASCSDNHSKFDL